MRQTVTDSIIPPVVLSLPLLACMCIPRVPLVFAFVFCFVFFFFSARSAGMFKENYVALFRKVDSINGELYSLV